LSVEVNKNNVPQRPNLEKFKDSKAFKALIEYGLFPNLAALYITEKGEDYIL